MEHELQFKIFNDKKLQKYLSEHSQWYKYLNRSVDNYKMFSDEYKKYNRQEQSNKFNSAMGTLDTVNTIFKIIN